MNTKTSEMKLGYQLGYRDAALYHLAFLKLGGMKELLSNIIPQLEKCQEHDNFLLKWAKEHIKTL